MNFRLILIFVMALALACNKDSSGPSNSSSTLPASYTRYSSQNQLSAWEDFSYDANQNITRISFLILDTGGSEVAIDSGNYSFTYTSGSNLPSGYTYNYHNTLPARGYDGGPQSEIHLLYYNGDERLVKDSGLNNMPTSYFSYSGNTITYSTWLHDADSVASYYRDSVLLDDQGMLAFNYQINKNGPNWDTYTIPYVNNENLKNPFYIKNLSGSLGILFLARGLGDFISHDLMTEYVTFDWIKNSSGRVISNIPGNGEIIQFTYF
ncbi:MAG TPA: hypothetical protein VK622_11555 [Puia sp.]|nr:hypothetical protein [Puia sp.]